MINQTAEQRYENLIMVKPEILQNAPLKNIATYLGITDTSLSRIRKEFVKKIWVILWYVLRIKMQKTWKTNFSSLLSAY